MQNTKRESEGKMGMLGRRLVGALILSIALSFHQLQWRVESLIPAKLDGFVYGECSSEFNPDAVLIEAFFDPVCPDSRDAWPPLKQALDFYGHRVSLIVHPFALPYHDNAFVTSRALHIVNKLNSSLTYPLLEAFFKTQERFYNQQTSNLSRTAVIDNLISFISESVGSGSRSEVKLGFADNDSNIKTRVSFKYGCSRGVYGTPFFFVNGFALPDAGDAIDFSGWRRIIDPLISTEKKVVMRFLE